VVAACSATHAPTSRRRGAAPAPCASRVCRADGSCVASASICAVAVRTRVLLWSTSWPAPGASRLLHWRRGRLASFNGVCNVWAPPPNNSVKRTAFRGRLPRALGVGVSIFNSGGWSQHAAQRTHQHQSAVGWHRHFRHRQLVEQPGCPQLRRASAPSPFAQERYFGQPHGQQQAHRVCYICGTGGVASFNGVCNVRAPPPNNLVKRTAFRGRLPRALEGNAMQRLTIAVLLGVSLSAAINAAIFALTPSAGVHWGLPFSIVRAVGLALAAVVPGFLAGWIAGRSGFLVGVLVGVGVAIISPLVASPFWGFWSTREVLVSVAVGIVTNAITQSWAASPAPPCGGGVLPSNNSVNRTQTPLRGLCAGYLGR